MRRPPDAPPSGHKDRTDGRSIPDQRNRSQATSEVAAADIRDTAARLSLRAAALGFVDFDDLLDLVRATGRLCDVMIGGAR
jgi:RNA:NAD 2'-phosphotransferase (TPT1/KptA family)